MSALAFKIAARAAELDNGPGRIFSLAIAEKTGSPFSHVEFWIDGPLTQARCFSSREPLGSGWAILDLSDKSLWTIVPLPDWSDQDRLKVEYFCRGSEGRDYDKSGIIGIDLDTGWHDNSDRFCSEQCMDIGQRCLGWRTDIPRWMVAPGWTKGGNRYGLFELATQGRLIV